MANYGPEDDREHDRDDMEDSRPEDGSTRLVAHVILGPGDGDFLPEDLDFTPEEDEL